MNEISKMKELIKQIQQADTDYYKNDNPIMSDRAYDAIVEQLMQLEAQTGITLSGSPTQHVAGEILEELSPVKHSKQMLSAAKTKSVKDLIKFAHGHDVILSWKLDGLTIVLRYDNGRLVQAITRGREGLIGEDVTHTVRMFLNVPLSVPFQEAFEVRGEGVISWLNFNKINSGIEEPYTHPRNLAAGSVRKLDPNKTRKRKIEFIAFELISNFNYSNKVEQLKFLEINGFAVVPHLYLTAEEGSERIEELISIFHPSKYAYPVDGLIMEYADLEYAKSLGATGHHENRMIALKWQDDLYETIFRGVELATTRTGMVSITGIFEPVEIDGTTVSKAYLHNVDIYNGFQFGIGDVILVYKANMIIPQIADNCTMSNTYKLPMTCPCCGAHLTVKTTSGGTRQLYCENPHCAAKLVQRFAHFCDKTRMNIEGLSEVTLEKFIGHGWICNFGDLYELERYHTEIVNTEGFGEKSYDRLQASVEKSRRCTLAQFIAGLGIPMVGRHAGKDLERYFHGSWDGFEQAIQSGFDFTQLPNFGKTMHDNIYQWYADTEEEKLWRPLLDKIEFLKEDNNMIANKDNPFAGKIVVATGKMMNYTREGIQLKLLSLGAKPADSVTKKTDYLIVGQNAGSKLAKAEQLGIKTLTEDEFKDMAGI